MRLDVYLTENGYAASRQRAKTVIESGNVSLDGVTVTKPSYPVYEGEHTVEVRDPLRYVGRGGLKLEAALEAFGISPAKKIALDIGASTGGFTDCLLQNGASLVYAVDAGEGQLAPSLCKDKRVVSKERLNARELSLSDLGGKAVDLIVMDVSFISATYILPRFPALLCKGGEAVCLIKPQFEVGKSMIGKGGIVKDRSAHLFAIERVLECAVSVGLVPTGLISSPIHGGDGNREFLVHFKAEADKALAIDKEKIRQVIDGSLRRE